MPIHEFKSQRDTVIKVLREIGAVDDLLLKKKSYLEIWNKIDMLSPLALDEVETQALEIEDYNVIPMSVLGAPNMQELVGTLSDMADDVME